MRVDIDKKIYTKLSFIINELSRCNPELLSSLSNPNAISFFLFDRMASHFLPKRKILTVKVNVPLEESALQLLYEALEILAKKYCFQIVKA